MFIIIQVNVSKMKILEAVSRVLILSSEQTALTFVIKTSAFISKFATPGNIP